MLLRSNKALAVVSPESALALSWHLPPIELTPRLSAAYPCKAVGSSDDLQGHVNCCTFSSLCCISTGWSLVSERAGKRWESELSAMLVLQAGLQSEEMWRSLGGICFELQFPTIIATLTLVESWYILTLRLFFQRRVSLSNYILHKKHLILLVWICHLWLSLHALTLLFWEPERRDLLLFLPFSPLKNCILSCANDFSSLN